MKKIGVLLVLLILITPICFAQSKVKVEKVKESDIQESSELVQSSDVNNKNYVYGRGLVVSLENEDIKYHHSDIIGSNMIITDSGGEVVYIGDYLPFGLVFNEVGKNDYGFSNKELDSTGLNYFVARYYDAELGRFLERDPVLSGNSFNYANNNPKRYVDPTGMQDMSYTEGIGDYGRFDIMADRGGREGEEGEGGIHWVAFGEDGKYANSGFGIPIFRAPIRGNIVEGIKSIWDTDLRKKSRFLSYGPPDEIQDWEYYTRKVEGKRFTWEFSDSLFMDDVKLYLRFQDEANKRYNKITYNPTAFVYYNQGEYLFEKFPELRGIIDTTDIPTRIVFDSFQGPLIKFDKGERTITIRRDAAYFFHQKQVEKTFLAAFLYYSSNDQISNDQIKEVLRSYSWMPSPSELNNHIYAVERFSHVPGYNYHTYKPE